ncbi:MAG: hypothetical protein OEW75_06840 [Cyclobacteriaceae bacterium]|nr:hypothetical protein [Cyclobacteriaceae bacterium]
MKKVLYIGLSVLLLVGISFLDANAQGNSNKNKGKGNPSVQKGHGPPPWAPAHGYRAKTRYVYFKDYDVYYDNQRGVYITLNGKNWTVTTRLPLRLKTVNLVGAVKIDLDFDGNDPNKYHSDHLKKYPKKRG